MNHKIDRLIFGCPVKYIGIYNGGNKIVDEMIDRHSSRKILLENEIKMYYVENLSNHLKTNVVLGSFFVDEGISLYYGPGFIERTRDHKINEILK